MIKWLKSELGLVINRRRQNRDWGLLRNVIPVLGNAVYIQDAWIEVGMEKFVDEDTFIHLVPGKWSTIERMKGKAEGGSTNLGGIEPIY